jgi:hypothetical protein
LSVNDQTLNCYDPLIWQEYEFTVTCRFKIRVQNKDFTGGTVYVNDFITPKTAPHDRSCTAGNVFNIGAIDQPSGGYNWIWNTSGTNNSQWIRKLSSGAEYFHSYVRNTTYTAQSTDKNTKLLADLQKILNNITFQNSFVGAGNGGVIKVNGVQYNSPKSGVQVVELNPVTSSSIYQVINGIEYIFTQWNDGNTTVNRTFYPSTNNTYTANYSGKPLSYSVMNTHFNDIVGQNVIIYWNDHPNPNVTQYQIWRIRKHNGVLGPAFLLATQNRGTTTYTDYDMVITRGYTNDLLWYDVRPYYSTENVYADPVWLPIYGEFLPKTDDSTANLQEIPLEFAVSCFPNPFNPETNIHVELPEDGKLQATIFNILGEKVLDLKNEVVTKGIYEFTWNGKDANSQAVKSGIYLVLIRTDSQLLTQKVILLK